MARLDGKLAIVEAFVQKLGDVSMFNYTGNVIDHGRGSKQQCVCGHPIRYGYEITNGKKTVEIGSECINHFSEYNPSLYESLKKAIEDRKEKEKADKKKLKEDANNAVLGPLIEEYRSLVKHIVKVYEEKYGSGWCSNYDFWRLVHRDAVNNAPYKSFAKKVEWYKGMIHYIKTF